MFGYIYVIENNVNGKFYVGQTANLVKRKEIHLGGHSGSPAIKSAVRKYGRDYFDFCIIERLSSQEELNSREIYWISELNTLAPDGYNLKKGGDCGGSLSDITKLKISANRKGKYIGVDNHQYGNPISEETKIKISASNKGKILGDQNPCFGKFGHDHPKFGVKHSEEVCNIRSFEMLGDKNPSYGKKGFDSFRFGKKHSEEARKRISESQKKRWRERKHAAGGA